MPVVAGSLYDVSQTRQAEPLPKNPILVAFIKGLRVFKQGTLKYWPIQRSGGQSPKHLSPALGVKFSYALAGDGHVVIVTDGGRVSTGEIIKYNVDTKVEQKLPDPYGQPDDVAVDKKGNIYALNGYGAVTVYKAGSSQPYRLACSTYGASTIAVNDEGDVLIEAITSSYKTLLYKFAVGSQTCKALTLQVPVGYIGIDPKTDDLIVVANDQMLIYKKPYEDRTVKRRKLHVTTAAYQFRLDADSTHIFYEDYVYAAHQHHHEIIDQAAYPSGKFEGFYEDGANGGDGYIGGFTTIPNALPN